MTRWTEGHPESGSDEDFNEDFVIKDSIEDRGNELRKVIEK